MYPGNKIAPPDLEDFLMVREPVFSFDMLKERGVEYPIQTVLEDRKVSRAALAANCFLKKGREAVVRCVCDFSIVSTESRRSSYQPGGLSENAKR